MITITLVLKIIILKNHEVSVTIKHGSTDLSSVLPCFVRLRGGGAVAGHHLQFSMTKKKNNSTCFLFLQKWRETL